MSNNCNSENGCNCRREGCGDCESSWGRCRECEQHVHELVGSTLVAERGRDTHNHRFATVSGEALACGDSHVHRVTFRTDSFDGHWHEFSNVTSPAIWVGDGRHVHFAKAETTSRDGHTHFFRVASLIDNPIECE